jgi:hypothetical protein
MPKGVDPNLRVPTLSPAMATAIRYIRDKRDELEKLNGEATAVTEGHIGGLTDVLACIVQGMADQTGRPAGQLPRAVIPPALVAAIAYARDKRGRLEQRAHDPNDVEAGHVVGITEALSLIVEAVADEANNPMSPL